MRRQKLITGLAVATLGFAGNALAFTTDGDLNDWLLSKTLWDKRTDVGIGIDINEDGLSDTYGGQSYDAERLMAAVDWSAGAEKLHVLVITGLKPESGNDNYVDIGKKGWRPGDLAIYTGNNYTSDQLWNVEHDNTGGDAITWNTDSWPSSNGVESAVTTDDHVFGLRIPDERDDAGTLDSEWDRNGSDPDGNTGSNAVQRNVEQGGRWFTKQRNSSSPRLVTSMDDDLNNDGTTTGTADVVYTEAKYNSDNFNPDLDGMQHYIIEMAISLTSLGWNGENSFNVALQWGMNCSNDWINGHGSWVNNPEPTPGVPEPGSLALIALGLVGMGYGRKRRANAKS